MTNKEEIKNGDYVLVKLENISLPLIVEKIAMGSDRYSDCYHVTSPKIIDQDNEHFIRKWHISKKITEAEYKLLCSSLQSYQELVESI